MQIYYYKGKDRLGPINPAQLRALAASGSVTPETLVEAGGKVLQAAKVKGLEFPAAVPPVSAPAPRQPVPITDPLPEMIPAGTEDPFEGPFRAASAALEKSAKNLNQIGWAVVVLWLVGLALAGIAELSSDLGGSAFFPALLSGIPSGVAASVFFFLAKLGRFLIAWTRYKNQ